MYVFDLASSFAFHLASSHVYEFDLNCGILLCCLAHSHTNIINADTDVINADTDSINADTNIINADSDVISTDTDSINADTDIINTDTHWICRLKQRIAAAVEVNDGESVAQETMEPQSPEEEMAATISLLQRTRSGGQPPLPASDIRLIRFCFV